MTTRMMMMVIIIVIIAVVLFSLFLQTEKFRCSLSLVAAVSIVCHF